ncbi:MAG TPA: DUF1573 domain-containing protein [Flavobacteriales bacterium]|jgi:hypothetical protein|nr:DUF1573 domain-containing protein [Flavobacteriales bacterium]
MKDNIKIALLAIIAAALIFLVVDHREHGASAAPTERMATASTPANANPLVQPPTNSFDPLTPPVQPPVDNGPKTSVKFAVMEHSFGKVDQDTENAYTFKFTNTGAEPLMISNAVGSCGCTVPDYPKQPIAPGATGEINVMYKPGKQQGQQHKTVTVTANTEPKETILNISADVQVKQ